MLDRLPSPSPYYTNQHHLVTSAYYTINQRDLVTILQNFHPPPRFVWSAWSTVIHVWIFYIWSIPTNWHGGSKEGGEKLFRGTASHSGCSKGLSKAPKQLWRATCLWSLPETRCWEEKSCLGGPLVILVVQRGKVTKRLWRTTCLWSLPEATRCWTSCLQARQTPSHLGADLGENFSVCLYFGQYLHKNGDVFVCTMVTICIMVVCLFVGHNFVNFILKCLLSFRWRQWWWQCVRKKYNGRCFIPGRYDLMIWDEKN